MKKISRACFDQPAARTANQFVVIVTKKIYGSQEENLI